MHLLNLCDTMIGPAYVYSCSFGAIRVPSNALNYIIIDCQKMVFVIFMENVYAGIRICMAAALKH